MLKLLDKSREINGTQPNYQDKIFRYKLKNIYRIVLCTIIVLAVILLIKLQIEIKIPDIPKNIWYLSCVC